MDDWAHMVAPEKKAEIIWSMAIGSAVVWALFFCVSRHKHRPVPVSTPAPESKPESPYIEAAPAPVTATPQPMVVMMSAPMRGWIVGADVVFLGLAGWWSKHCHRRVNTDAEAETLETTPPAE
jgi:hypothetical protein